MRMQVGSASMSAGENMQTGNLLTQATKLITHYMDYGA